jgi:hypothetical protein
MPRRTPVHRASLRADRAAVLAGAPGGVLLLGAWFGALVGCSEQAKLRPGCEQGEVSCGEEAPDGEPELDASQPAPRDAGTLQPLAVTLRVNGDRVPCGSCSVLIAQVLGGQAPYSYVWSDPALTGPGPHSVCPAEPTRYSVKVTDSSDKPSFAEFESEAMVVEAETPVGCVTADGGTELWGGCFPPSGEASADAGNGESQECAWIDMVPPFAGALGGETTRVPVGFSFRSTNGDEQITPGKPYEISYDQVLFQLSVSQPVSVRIYGSNEPCGTTQLYGTHILDGTWHQSFCFVPEQAWKYTRVDVDIGDVFLYIDFVPPVSTTCKGCSLSALGAVSEPQTAPQD